MKTRLVNTRLERDMQAIARERRRGPEPLPMPGARPAKDDKPLPLPSNVQPEQKPKKQKSEPLTTPE